MDVAQGSLLELLELQKIDSTIDRLINRRKHLPEQVELDELEVKLDELTRAVGEQKAIVDEIALRQRKLDNDVEMIGSKIEHEEKKLFDGAVTNPRELSALQSEVESLKRRLSTLEDADLEVMEEREGAEKILAELDAQAADLRAQIAEVTVRRDAAQGDVGTQLQMAEEERARWEPKFDRELLSFYDELRRSKGGVGAAALVGGTCQGCHMQLPAQEVERLRKATGLLRCEECRRILVVT